MYEYTQFINILTTFLADFELRLNNISPIKIPVMLLETGDETLLNTHKHGDKNDYRDVYLKVPRCVIQFDSTPELDSENDTNKFNQIEYIYNNKIYTGMFRRKSINIPLTANIVCSNYIMALQFMEIILTVFGQSNKRTYNFFGNNMLLQYNQTGIEIEKNSMDLGSQSRNTVVKVSITIATNIMVPRYNSIKLLGETLGNFGNEGKYISPGDADNNKNNGKDDLNTGSQNDGSGIESGRDKNKSLWEIQLQAHLCDEDGKTLKMYTHFDTLKPWDNDGKLN